MKIPQCEVELRAEVFLRYILVIPVDIRWWGDKADGGGGGAWGRATTRARAISNDLFIGIISYAAHGYSICSNRTLVGKLVIINRHSSIRSIDYATEKAVINRVHLDFSCTSVNKNYWS